jgi:nitroimidazol reductase NimA-like FMN-containing flavoprotein (pyridoxamine 5'-phosphate oxidase superfamily)
MPEPNSTAPNVATGEVAVTERTRLRRISEHGSHRIADVHAVLDSGFVCHLGLVVDGWPMVVPTSYGRLGQYLFLHGSVASRSLRAARTPIEVCVTVTHIDGLVLARSVFEHAVNYRCAMIYGVPEVLNDPAEKLIGLQTISDQVAPGQWEYARSPSATEIAATTVLRMTLDQCSVKIRRGPPDDGDGPDAELGLWAGEIPLRTVRLDPVADPALPAGIPVPGHLTLGRPAPGSTPTGELAPQITPS